MNVAAGRLLRGIEQLGELVVGHAEHRAAVDGGTLLRGQRADRLPQRGVVPRGLRLRRVRLGRPLGQGLDRHRAPRPGPMRVDRLVLRDLEQPASNVVCPAQPRVRAQRRYPRLLEAVVRVRRAGGGDEEAVHVGPLGLVHGLEGRQLHSSTDAPARRFRETASGADEDRSAERHPRDQPARLLRPDPHASEAHRRADAAQVGGGMDRKPVATGPVVGQIGLVAGERQDAAAVRRVVVGHLELVRHGEPPEWRGVAAGADRDRELADSAPVLAHEQLPLRQVGMERPAHAVHTGALAWDPRDLAVLQLRRLDPEPVAALAYDAEHPRRSPLRAFRDPQPGLAARLAVEDGRLLHVRRRVAGRGLGLRGERRLERPTLRRHEVPCAVAAAGIGTAVRIAVAELRGGHQSGRADEGCGSQGGEREEAGANTASGSLAAPPALGEHAEDGLVWRGVGRRVRDGRERRGGAGSFSGSGSGSGRGTGRSGTGAGMGSGAGALLPPRRSAWVAGSACAARAG